MSVQWYTPRDISRWVSKSADGYYAIAPADYDLGFESFHIAQLWATPKSIGTDPTILEARQRCDDHRQQPAGRA